MIDEYNFNEIKEKHNYDDNFSKLLEKIYDALVAYYGNNYREKFFVALYNIKIVLSDKKLNEEYNLNDSMCNININVGAYLSKPNIITTYSGYDLDLVKRVIIVYKSKNKTNFLKALIHTIIHAAKSFKNEYILSGNLITIRSGLITKEEEITVSAGNIQRKQASLIGYGLEEGLSLLETNEILSKYFIKNYESDDYEYLVALAKTFREESKLKCQITALSFGVPKKLPNEEEFKKLLKSFDKFYKIYHEYEVVKDALEEDKKKEYMKKLSEIINKEIGPKCRKVGVKNA